MAAAAVPTTVAPDDLAGRPPAPAAGRRFLFAALAITVFAFGLREYFIVAAVPENAIRGDIRDYVAYAHNLLEHGTFSRAHGGAAVVADAYRGPGYPLFLAGAMALGGDPGWYPLALRGQALAGALTCLLLMLAAVRWLRPGWALAAGGLLALWPHHVAATGALLSEVWLGFLLALALWTLARAQARGDVRWAAASGLAFGAAGLANPVAVPLAALLALPWCLERRWRPAAALVLAAGALLLPWQVRHAQLEPDQRGPSRAAINFVQGSWPLYHAAYNDQDRHPRARATLDAIAAEERLMLADRRAGLAAVVARLAAHPGDHLRWYLLEKPFLLWDWNIRIGAGDVYFHRVSGSPLESHPVLSRVKVALRHANPVLFGLALVTAMVVATDVLRRPDRRRFAAPALAFALVFLYFTAVHAVFQAEPRYANAYRALQLALACTGPGLLAGGLAARMSRRGRRS